MSHNTVDTASAHEVLQLFVLYSQETAVASIEDEIQGHDLGLD